MLTHKGPECEQVGIVPHTLYVISALYWLQYPQNNTAMSI